MSKGSSVFTSSFVFKYNILPSGGASLDTTFGDSSGFVTKNFTLQTSSYAIRQVLNNNGEIFILMYNTYYNTLYVLKLD
ncbi:MAG: hypothetical protein OHK0036_18160 [Bacteroidia bacterium]